MPSNAELTAATEAVASWCPDGPLHQCERGEQCSCGRVARAALEAAERAREGKAVTTAKDIIAKAFGHCEREDDPVMLASEAADGLIGQLEAAGFVIVPIEPTEEMIENGAYGSGEDSRSAARGAWDAMIETHAKERVRKGK